MTLKLTSANFMPDYIKRAFNKIDLNLEYEFWSPHELKALSILLNSNEMLEVYEAISLYNLDEQMWRELLIHGLAEPYAYVVTKQDEVDARFEGIDEHFFPELSKKLHDLYSILNSPQMDYFSHCDSDFYYKVTARSEELQKHLFNLLRLTTSLKWPENYYQYLTNPKLDGAWADESVDTLKLKESPALSPQSEDFGKAFKFPEPTKETDFSPKNNYPYKKFIAYSLEKIGVICEKNQRERRRFKLSTRIIPSKFNLLYIENKHWNVICRSLFDLSEQDISDVSKIQSEYRKRAGVIDQPVKENKKKSKD